MHVHLSTHPAHPTAVVSDIQVTVTLRSPNLLHLHYFVFGEVDDIVLPAPAAPIRTDYLWRTTCLEAFLAPAGVQAYRELNFSPSSQWAACDFASHREPEGGIDARLPAPPEIMLALRANRIEIEVSVPVHSGQEPIRLGLSAVIEEKTGHKSYWALAHPPGAPDFHHPDCFVLELPPAV